jgi:3-oxoacyl-[acyl-carrier-protein] synthase-3
MAFLRGFGCALPAEVVDNEALAARTGKEAASIEKNTGMRERRYAAEGVSVVDLGEEAARSCLKKANVSAEEIGLVLFSCGSMERCFPGPASTLAARLGMTSTPAIDLPIASAGSLVAIAMAADMALHYGNILIVASEICRGASRMRTRIR